MTILILLLLVDLRILLLCTVKSYDRRSSSFSGAINQVTLSYDVVFNNVPENVNASESYSASAGLSIFDQDGQVSGSRV